MKKIGIITFHDADNFGAVLQAYALKETIKKVENDVEILNYKQPLILKSYRIIQINTNNLKSLIKSVLSSIIYLNIRISRKIKFSSFRNKYLDLSEEIYKKSEIQGKDVYIAGSDQIWNGEITGYDNTFFLSFPRGTAKGITYAASLGKDMINDQEREFLNKNINNIDCISVREDSAVHILYGFTDKKISHVLDPTLLVEQSAWDKLIIDKYNHNKEKYLLIYSLSFDIELLRVAELVSKKLNLKVLYINNSIRRNKFGFKNIRTPSPEEFVTLFKNASFIVTNSFHGTAFSIIFNKDFITIPHKMRGTRMTSLLNLLKLEDRIITSSDQLTEDFILNIDYHIPNELLKLEKEKSFAFLKQSIEGSAGE